jgi:chitodextrinase
MARSTTLDLAAYSWTQLTADDAAGITFQNLTGNNLWIQAMGSATAPTELKGSIVYKPDEGERNAALSDLFPGVTTPVRVYAWTEKGGPVFVSHD